jgi:protein O-GlcNAc transferase
MKKVISFSLWCGIGATCSSNDYFIGAIKNAKLALKMYPDFECWFYIHKESVPQNIIYELNSISNTKIIYKTGDLNKIKPMTWRFESIDHPDVEINLSRDTDTRFLLREKLAVEEWIKSDKIFHIMRDHPHHRHRILGGMFGIKKNTIIKSWKKLINNKISQNGPRDYDQIFLQNIIYPLILKHAFVHSSFYKYKGEYVKPFPIPYCNKYYFVGGYVYKNETVSKEHTNILKNISNIS